MKTFLNLHRIDFDDNKGEGPATRQDVFYRKNAYEINKCIQTLSCVNQPIRHLQLILYQLSTTFSSSQLFAFVVLSIFVLKGFITIFSEEYNLFNIFPYEKFVLLLASTVLKLNMNVIARLSSCS